MGEIHERMSIQDGQEIILYIPIAHANNWQLLLIYLFCKPKKYESKELTVQYVTLFGRRYWTRKWFKTKDSALRADEQLQKHKEKHSKNQKRKK